MQGLHLSESCREQVAALPAGTRHPGAAPSLKLRKLHSSRSERGRSTRYHALLAAAKFADCLAPIREMSLWSVNHRRHWVAP